MLDLYESKEAPRKHYDIEATSAAVYVPNWDNQPVPKEPVVTISPNGGMGYRIASEGNICVVVAQPGVGKSAVCEALCSSALNPRSDTFGLSVNLNYERKVLYIDSERDIDDHHGSWRRMLLRSGIRSPEDDTMPDGSSFSQSIVDFQLWTTVPSNQARMDLLFNLIESEGYALIIIDGFGDFVRDVNDAEEVDKFASGLRSLIIKHRVAIFGTIHANPNDEKARGHLGSELIRRAESVFLLQREDDQRGVRKLTTDYKHGKVRNATDNLGARFEWNFREEMFTSLNMTYRPVEEIIEKDRLMSIAWNTIGNNQLTYDEIRIRMETGLRMTRKQAETEIGKLFKTKMIVRNDITRKYELNKELER